MSGADASSSESALCRRYAGRIRGYGLRHLRDQAASEDLVQHVLLIVLQAVREGRAAQATLDGYVLVTCRNCVMDMRRGEWRQRRVAAQAAAGLPEGYEPPWSIVDARRLEGCLRQLEARDRAVVMATFVQDRDAEEIRPASRSAPATCGSFATALWPGCWPAWRARPERAPVIRRAGGAVVGRQR